jgi:NitT/TauT family transport system substrate-binding protein
VDAIGQFTVGEPLIEASVKPRKLVRLAYKDGGLDYYGNGIIATEQTIKDSPDLLKAFMSATLRGMRDAFANPAEAGAVLNKYHKEISPEVGTGETELVRELAVLPGRPLGAIDEEGIKRTVDIMAKSYPMKQPVDPKDMYAPGFIE